MGQVRDFSDLILFFFSLPICLIQGYLTNIRPKPDIPDRQNIDLSLVVNPGARGSQILAASEKNLALFKIYFQYREPKYTENCTTLS